LVLKALQAMVRASHKMQKQRSRKQSGLSAVNYVQEYCTVRLQGPRQAGHTTAIAKFLVNWPTEPVVVGRQACNKRFEECLQKQCDGVQRPDVRYVTTSLKGLRGMKDINIIILDSASTQSANLVDKLYKEAAAVFSEYKGPCHLILIG
jgi:hypothetical protein